MRAAAWSAETAPLASPVRAVLYGLPGIAEGDFAGARGVAIASSRDELEELLALHDVEVVAFSWEDGVPELVRRVRSATRLLHFGAELAPGLVRAIEDGWEIGHLDDLEALRQLVLTGTDARRRRADRQVFQHAALEHRGGSAPFELVDLANGGFGFRMGGGSDLDKYLPGTRLERVRVHANGAIALDGVDAVVRHLTIDGAEYRVGCVFEPPEPAPPRSSLRDRAVCAGLVSAALRDGGVLVKAATRDGLRVHLDHTNAEVTGEGVMAFGAFHRFRAFEDVTGAFERGGLAYRFTTVIVKEAPLVLRLPEAIEQPADAVAPRFRPPPSSPVRVELRSPLLGVHLRAATEISATHLVVDLGETDVLPVGSHFSSVTLRLAGAAVTAGGRVESHERAGGGVRCSIALIDLDQQARVTLARFLMKARFPESTSTAPRFDEVLAFFRETGFMPPDKERVLAPMMTEVRRTFETLAAKPCTDFQSVMYGDSEIVGHLSGARAYSRTFLYQHLAGRRGKSVAGPLILSLTEHLLQLGEYEYFKFFFLKGNPFPTRVLESFGRKVGDPWRSDMREYAHVMLTTSEPLVGATFAVEVDEAEAADLREVERFFVATHQGLLLRADDLTRQKLPLGDVDARYRELGLHRTRRILVARRDGRLVGFALAEVSSPGLNLSEGLSSARVYVLDAGRATEDDVRVALLRGLQSLYASVGRGVVFALVAPEDTASFARIGIPTVATSLCVTAHASLLPEFFNHVQSASLGPRAAAAPGPAR